MVRRRTSGYCWNATDDAIKFISQRNTVHLTVKKKIDGTTKVISIVRDLVQLEETL